MISKQENAVRYIAVDGALSRQFEAFARPLGVSSGYPWNAELSAALRRVAYAISAILQAHAEGVRNA